MHRYLGPLAVVSIVLLGVGLAAFNIWFRHAATRRIHERWGTETLTLIAHAPEVELEVFSPPPAPGSAVPLGQPSRTIDLNRVKGLANFRYALGQDDSYDWPADDASVGELLPRRIAAEFAIHFRNREDSATILFSLREERPWALLSGGIPLPLSKQMAAGVGAFVRDAQATAAAKAASTAPAATEP